jgi:allantoin racemase
MKLLVVRPVVATDQLSKLAGELGADELRETCGCCAELEVVYLPYGPSSLECEYDESIAAPAICEVVRNRRSNVDGILVDCFADPGVDAAREIAGGRLVLGAGEAALTLATLLGERICVVTVLDSVSRMIRRRAERRRLTGCMTRTRSVDIPVLATVDRKRLVAAITREGLDAVRSEDADVLVLGCTGLRNLADEVAANLRNETGFDIPVVDPTVAGTRVLEALVGMGIPQSRLAYATPPDKLRVLPVAESV